MNTITVCFRKSLSESNGQRHGHHGVGAVEGSGVTEVGLGPRSMVLGRQMSSVL
jgi:hypothetical protein